MAEYSIKELEKLSGIKAHTIRIWEKRYNLIEPQRTHTNIRYYSDFDLRKIISVSLLNNNGIKISKIADMSLADINQKVLAISEQKSDVNIHIDQLVIAMVELEEEQFEKILSNLILRYGFEKTITEIMYPFLEKIGILWQTQNITPAQEHFISNLIRQKIIVAIDSLPLPPKTSQSVVLYLREKELHEIGLLFYHYIVRKAGYRTYYLGQNVPHDDLLQVVATHQPVMIITSITSTLESMQPQAYLIKLAHDFASQRILVSGYQLNGIEKPEHENVFLFKNSVMLKELIQADLK
jgi:MerR family transcriptional regulator, light-induced transcriptional regulator